jgi:hypothetical protein
MRSAGYGLLLLSLSSIAWGQSAPKEPDATVITLGDLEGMTIQTSHSFSARFRSPRGEAPGGWTARREIKIGPGDAIELRNTRDSWVDTPAGPKTGQNKRSMMGTIGVPDQAKNDTVARLFLLEGNTLTLVAVLETGATTVRITFQKGPSGLSCSAVQAMAQEVGAGPMKDKSDAGSGKVQILKATPTSSSCELQPTVRQQK